MSVEFSATVVPADNSLVAIVRAISESQEYDAIDSSTESLLLIRFRGIEQTGKWAEDVAVEATDTGLLVSFHSATAGQRERLLDLVTQALLHDGRAITIEEL